MQLFRKFPFKDKPNIACITCSHILDENKPILYVSHDYDDGCWHGYRRHAGQISYANR